MCLDRMIYQLQSTT